MIVLMSSDGEKFRLEEMVALQSEKIKQMMEDGLAGSTISVPHVNGKILSKVVEYLNKHGETPKGATKVTAKDLKAFDAEFVDSDLETLFGVILAANYLNIKTLLIFVSQAVLDMTNGKSMEHIRDHLYRKKDLTAEEEERIRLENAWAFDDYDEET